MTDNKTLTNFLPHTISWDELNAYSFAMYGCLYVFITDVLLYPADLLTTKLQADKFTNQKGIKVTKVVEDIVKREGIKGLFRGFVPSTVGSFPGQLLYYITYEWCNQKIQNLLSQFRQTRTMEQNKDLDAFIGQSLSGFSAEMAAGVAYLPTDIISQRLQIERKVNFLRSQYQFRNSFDIISHIWTTEGIRGFYRGYLPYIIVFGPNSAIWWASYETFKKIFFLGMTKLENGVNRLLYTKYLPSSTPHSSTDLPSSLSPSHTSSIFYSSLPEGTGFFIPGKTFINHFISGALGGVCACVATNPLDVARTRLQLLEAADPREKSKIKGGFTRLLVTIFREEGIRGWYKGIKPRVFIKIPGSAIAFLGYEMLKEKSRKDQSRSQLPQSPDIISQLE